MLQIFTRAELSGGPLHGQYVFNQFHMHWGSGDGWGSEHTLDGRAFPAELHIVHLNRNYGSAQQALEHKDGLAVVGVFIELGEYPFANFDCRAVYI